MYEPRERERDHEHDDREQLTYKYKAEYNTYLIRKRYIQWEDSLPTYICTICFKNNAFHEMQEYVKNTKYKCIYGAPKEIKEKILPHKPIFVLELNIPENRISGIGLIYNHGQLRTHRIHKDNNLNRFCYTGLHRIDRSEFQSHEKHFIDVLEYICLRGKYNAKKSQGILKLPTKYQYNCLVRLGISFMECMQQMFKDRNVPF